MAESGNPIAGVGQGFFNETGKLKTKEELELKKSDKATTETKQADPSFKEDLGNVLGRVRSDVRAQVNEVTSRINTNDGQLKDARELVKKELSIAKDLKKAIKDGDQPKIENLREGLQAVQNKRSELADQVKENNSTNIGKDRKNLNFGNKQLGIVQVKNVEFEKSSKSEAELKTAKQVDAYIDTLNQDLDNIKGQRQELKETRKEVKDISQELQNQIDAISQDSVKTYEEASKLAERIAANSQGIVASNISATVAHKLLVV